MVGASTSRLTFDNGTAAAQTVTTSPGQFVLNVVMVLNSPLLATVNQSGELWLGRLIEAGGVRSLTKRGSGSLVLFESNAYTGVTKVERGMLAAIGPVGTLQGDVEVGTGNPASSATALLGTPGQLQPTATITVRAGGMVRIESTETVSRVVIEDGFLQLIAGDFRTQELTMTGGIVEIIGPFVPPAVVVTTSSALRTGGDPGGGATLGRFASQRGDDVPGGRRPWADGSRDFTGDTPALPAQL